MNAIYEYLSHSNLSKEQIEYLKCMPFWFCGDRFVDISKMAFKFSFDFSPYLFKVPSEICREFRSFYEALGVKESFDYEDYRNALERAHDDMDGKALSEGLLKSCVTALIEMSMKVANDKPIYLPSLLNVLCVSDSLQYQDLEEEADGEFKVNVVCKYISKDVSIKLRVKMASSVFQENSSTDFGQHEPLSDRIRNIIAEYPRHSIIKEMLQNADDAKATKLFVIYDKRTHGNKSLFSERMSDFQGPSLLFYNDKEFSNQDIENIQKLGNSSKSGTKNCIGRFDFFISNFFIFF